MASQTGKHRQDWRRAGIGVLASGAVAGGFLVAFAAPTAFAQPAEPTETPTAEARAPGENCTGEDCSEGEVEPKRMSAAEALTIIQAEYAQGDGGGQLSKLIDDAVRLQAQGFRPSNANAAALEDALAHRPNQTPLVEALKETIAYQRKLQAQAELSAAEQGPVAGPVPVILGPNVGITLPPG